MGREAPAIENIDPGHWEIGDIIGKLIQNQEYYSTILAGIERVPDKSISTLGISYAPKSLLGVKLRYNPEFVKSYAKNPLEFQYMIETQASHLLFQHMLREWMLGVHKMPLEDQKKYGIAQGMSISSILSGLNSYKGRLNYSTFKPVMPGDFDLPAELTFEQYKQMLDDVEQNGTPDQKQKLKEMMDDKNFTLEYRYDGSEMDENGNPIEGQGDAKMSPGDVDKAAAQQRLNLQDYLQNAVQSAKSRGTLPGWMKDLISEFFQIQEPAWSSLLRAAIATGELNTRKTVWNRPNRRLLGLKRTCPTISVFPGKRRDAGFKIAAILDTSGSMDHGALAEGLSVIYNMVQKNEDYEFHVVEADYNVHKSTKVTDSAQIKQIMKDIHGRGGTSFQIPIDWTMENVKPDIIVYCTDGYGESQLVAPRVPVVWFITRSGMLPSYGFGKVVQIKVK